MLFMPEAHAEPEALGATHQRVEAQKGLGIVVDERTQGELPSR